MAKRYEYKFVSVESVSGFFNVSIGDYQKEIIDYAEKRLALRAGLHYGQGPPGGN